MNAARAWKEGPMGLNINTRTIIGKFTVGATGVVSTTSMKGASVARGVTAGSYTITLEDSYSDLLGVQVIVMNTSASNGYWNVVSESVDTSTGGTVNIAQYDIDDDTAEEVASGATVFVRLDLAKTSLGVA